MLRQLYQELQAKPLLSDTWWQPEAAKGAATTFPPDALRQLELALKKVVAGIPWLSPEQAATVQGQLVQTARRQLVFEINGAALLAELLLALPDDQFYYEGVAAWVRSLLGWSPNPLDLGHLARELRWWTAAVPQRPAEQLLAVVVWAEQDAEPQSATKTEAAATLQPQRPTLLRHEPQLLQIIQQGLLQLTRIKEYQRSLLRQLPLNRPWWSAAAAGLIICALVTAGFVNKDKLLGSAVNAAVPKLGQKQSLGAVSDPAGLRLKVKSNSVTIPGSPLGEYQKKIVMQATAYDLSVESCGKTREHPEYGITYSGKRATVGRTVALDPTVVPLGSRVYIVFPDQYSQLNGIYSAEDTGRLVKGNRVDIFFGEDQPGERLVYQKARQFGVQPVELYLLK